MDGQCPSVIFTRRPMRESMKKSLLPAEAPRIFTRTGDYRLVLITCGGAFDEGARSYLSNVVITALPAPAISE